MTIIIDTITRRVAGGMARAGTVFAGIMEAIAEAKVQRATLETELYRGRYRHWSKADDDLPVVR